MISLSISFSIFLSILDLVKLNLCESIPVTAVVEVNFVEAKLG